MLFITSIVNATEVTQTVESQDASLLVSENPDDALVSTLDQSLDETLIAPADGQIDVIYEEDTTAVPSMPKIVEHDVYVTTADYVLEENEHINGNVYIMANTVKISGYIEGNVFILAKDVTLNSPCRIEKSLYIAANNINFYGGYLYDIYATANKINFSTNAYSIRDVKFATNTINLAGYFGRNLDLVANEINPDLSDLKVQNNFTYSAPTEIKDVQRNVEGDVKYTPTSLQEEPKTVVLNTLKSLLGILVFSLIVACVLIYIFKNFTNKSAKIIEGSLLKAFGYGLLVMICVPILSILLFISLYGACVGGALLFSLAAILSISNVIVSVAIARKLKGEDKKATLLFSMLFVLAIWILKLIPYIGSIVRIIVWILGAGITTLALLNKEEKIEKDNSAKKVEYGKEELEEIKAEEKAEKEEKKVQKAEKKVEKKPTEKKTTTKSTKKK